jgi:hypothetical protein
LCYFSIKLYKSTDKEEKLIYNKMDWIFGRNRLGAK